MDKAVWHACIACGCTQVPEGVPGVAPEHVGSEVEGLCMRPGLAMSQDGRNWARIEGDHHTGALFDVGEAGQWDEMYVGHPMVGSRYLSPVHLWYVVALCGKRCRQGPSMMFVDAASELAVLTRLAIRHQGIRY